MIMENNILQKSKLFVLGGCDLWDAVDSGALRRQFSIDRYSFPKSQILLDFDPVQYRPCATATSLRSLYSQPGDIALRIYESLKNVKNLSHLHQSVYEETMKYPYLEFYRKHAGPNDILVLSFSPELYTKVLKKSECFSILPNMASFKNPSDPLHWLYTEYLTNDSYHIPFDESENVSITYDIMLDFVKDIRAIFGNRVIVVKTHLSDKVFSSTINKVDQIKLSCEYNIPFYKVTKLMQTPTDYHYAKRMTDLLVQGFLRYYKEDLPVVEISNEETFIADKHKYGFSPFHLHRASTSKIGNKILIEAVKLLAKLPKK